ncbi:gfo/Idh/MocA family oxidoreductase, partial [bacterium]|nr:gfo/Idh/MocA family oxidoreductase [bacterium]
QIELFGTEAGAKVYPPTIYQTVNGAPQDIACALRKGYDPWDAIAGHFIDCVLDGVECDAPLRHGLVIQQLLEALLKSAAAGREVRVDAR